MHQSIEVLLFAAIRDAASTDTLNVPIDDQTTAGDVLQAIATQLTGVAALVHISRLAINGKYVPAGFELASINVNETEFALIPPVSGG